MKRYRKPGIYPDLKNNPFANNHMLITNCCAFFKEHEKSVDWDAGAETFRKLVHSGKVNGAFKVGRRWYVTPANLLSAIKIRDQEFFKSMKKMGEKRKEVISGAKKVSRDRLETMVRELTSRVSKLEKSLEKVA